jgi:hypothetical protein
MFYGAKIQKELITIFLIALSLFCLAKLYGIFRFDNEESYNEFKNKNFFHFDGTSRI